MKRTAFRRLVLILCVANAAGCAPAGATIVASPTLTPSQLPATPIPKPTATATKTTIPSATPVPGKNDSPVASLGKGVPWLTLDKTKIPGAE